MTLGLSTPTFDLAGAVLFQSGTARSRLEDRARRVSRTATLDGSAVLTDSGFSHADRTLEIAVEAATRAQFAAVAYLVENYSEIVVCTERGAYKGAPSALRNNQGTLNLTVLVSELLSAEG